MGGGELHPRRKRQAGGWEQGRACTQGQGHRARGQRLGYGRAQPESPCIWEQHQSWRGAGNQKIRFHPLSSLSPSRAGKGTRRVCERVADRATWP